MPYARAKISLRVHPEQDPVEAQAALVRHLEGLHAVRHRAERHAAETGKGFVAKTTGPAYEAARGGARDAPGAARRCRSRPAARSRSSARCSEAAPEAEMLLFGTTDGFANIHAPNERVLLDEFEKAVLAEAEFFGSTPHARRGGAA